MRDIKTGNEVQAGGPSNDCPPITPNDNADIGPFRAFYVTTAGTYKFRTVSGNDRTVTLPANYVWPVGIDRFYATGSTVTSGIVGLP